MHSVVYQQLRLQGISSRCIHCLQLLKLRCCSCRSMAAQHQLSSLLQIKTSNNFLKGALAILAAATVAVGPLAMFNLYVVPYWINVVWLDIVTYLHHHGPHDETERMPWYRGAVRSVTFNKGLQDCDFLAVACLTQFINAVSRFQAHAGQPVQVQR